MPGCKISEIPRRIISKAILWILSPDIQDAAGPLQACAGQVGGCEAAIHAMRQIFINPEAEGALLIDAENAFNSIIRIAALHNISIICPPFSQVLINSYRNQVRMVVPGKGEIASCEGTTQGDQGRSQTLKRGRREFWGPRPLPGHTPFIWLTPTTFMYKMYKIRTYGY